MPFMPLPPDQTVLRLAHQLFRVYPIKRASGRYNLPLMAWVYLFIAGLMEVVWAIALKFSEGFTRPLPVAVVIVAGLLSFLFLSLAVRELPIGSAYAIWVGIGAVGVALLGILWFHEPVNFWRLFFIGLIVAGVIGLLLVTKNGH